MNANWIRPPGLVLFLQIDATLQLQYSLKNSGILLKISVFNSF